jgi:hypothetical protein
MGLDIEMFAQEVTVWVGNKSRPNVRIRLETYGNGQSVHEAL